MKFIRTARLEFLPPRWRLPSCVVLGACAGLGLATAHVSRAASYLGDAPETCANCHVMFPQYSTWRHGSHANAATCNDCHVPHDSAAGGYAFKARDGLYHSYVFTFRLEPQVIRLSAGAVPVVQGNCLRCHPKAMETMRLYSAEAERRRCWECHDSAHGRERSLAATPRVMDPALPPVLSGDSGLKIGARPPRPEKQGVGK